MQYELNVRKKLSVKSFFIFEIALALWKSITRDFNKRGLFRNRDRSVNFKVDFNYTRHIFLDVYLIRSFNRFSLSDLQSSLEAGQLIPENP